MLNGSVEAVLNRRDFLQIVLQHLLAIEPLLASLDDTTLAMRDEWF